MVTVALAATAGRAVWEVLVAWTGEGVATEEWRVAMEEWRVPVRRY